jgi:methionyl-tRNA formyltransferase
MKEKIVFFGAGPYVDLILDVIKQKFDVALVVSKLNESSIDEIKKTGARVAVLASFGQIVTEEAMSLFPLGIINIHPSLLPQYRGATPVQTAILNGSTDSGVSIMKLDDKLDHGPILAQEVISIEQNDTTESLYKRAFEKGANLLTDVLPRYISGELKPNPQDNSKATFTAKELTRESGFIDINESPEKEQLDRMIRAYYPWPGVWFKTELNGNVKIIKLFPGNKIQVEGKNIMLIKDFTNGYPEGNIILKKLNLNV